VNPALDAPEAMVTDAGTVTALELLARITVVALVAGPLRVAVQVSVAAPERDALLHERPLSAGGADDDGLNCSVKVSETPLYVAVSVTVCCDVTGKIVAVNGSLVSSDHTPMIGGT